MSAKPPISAVVLSYNRPAMLVRALESVYRQGYPSLEVIVVDNRSPSSDAVAQVVERFPGVRFLPQSENLGYAGGMNVGLGAATGDFIHLTEDDIVLGEHFYDELVPVALARPRCLL